MHRPTLNILTQQALPCFESTMNTERTNDVFLSPESLSSTQFTMCPSNSHVRPYRTDKDPGIVVGRDEFGCLWILDGHSRVGAATHDRTMIKVRIQVPVNQSDMLDLIE